MSSNGSVERQHWRGRIVGEAVRAIDQLTVETGLSRQRVKRLMEAGAVWITTPPARGERRLRRATSVLIPGTEWQVYLDPALLERAPPEAKLIEDLGRLSVWYKPAGMLSQGTAWGDHCSLLRWAEQHLQPRRPVFLVHRLDREAQGLMVIAHDSRTAGVLSVQWQTQQVLKRYRARVRGCPPQPEGSLDWPLDGRPALTRYRRLSAPASADACLLEVEIATGRKHQIRRHLERAGYPVLGDPRYGRDNKDPRGLALAAVTLAFVPPGESRSRTWHCPEDWLPVTLQQDSADTLAPEAPLPEDPSA